MKLIGLILFFTFLFGLFIIIGIGSFLRTLFNQSKSRGSEREHEKSDKNSNKEKIFNKNEGEYVDFEEIKEKEKVGKEEVDEDEK